MTPILDWFRFNFIFSATCLHMARTFVFCVVSSKIFGCFILLGYLFAYFVHCRLLLKFGGGSKSKESFIWDFWLILRSGHQRMSYFACSRRLSYQFSAKFLLKRRTQQLSQRIHYKFKAAKPWNVDLHRTVKRRHIFISP